MTSALVPAPAPPRTVSHHRVSSLDGLRGIAALIVVLHHAMLTVPSLATAYYPSQGDIPTWSPFWFLTYTPLHLLWAGTEAVALFFVLSGVVLVLPLASGRPFSWRAYYPKRAIRLYGPVIAAVLLGLLTILVVQRHNGDGLGPWMNARPNEYSLDAFWRDITLVQGASGVISPLWSLRWEVLFSLLLPVYVVFARAPVPGWLKGLTLITLIGWSSLGQGQYFYYLPMFAIGAVVVAHWPELRRLAARADAIPRAWPVFLGVAVLLTCSRWELIGLGMSDATAARQVWISVIGVTMLVLGAAFCAPVGRMLQQRPIQWLGAVSFSLYLVHEPIIIAIRFLTVGHSPWYGLVISLPLALAVAAVFARLVERPLQAVARRAAGLVAR